MTFDALRAARRFGCGLSPDIPAPTNAATMLEAVSGPDAAAQRFPVDGFDVARDLDLAIHELSRAVRSAETDAAREEAAARRGKLGREFRDTHMGWFRHTLLRRALTEDGFRERLAFFWGDHFTAHSKGGPLRYAHACFVEDAIRPNLAGRFADMLIAAVTHPLMLLYLDQVRSAGPNSIAAQRHGGQVGLNENLARELMELHTLGVGGSYGQGDVRDLAALLTGLSYRRSDGFAFRARIAEPGVLPFMGRAYGGDTPTLDRVVQVLEDLAAHPDTADHIARKLAMHFTGDTPDPDMIRRMRDAYLQNGGQLVAVYAAMLDHPAAWHDAAGNVKQPIDFVGSSLRALGIAPRHLSDVPRLLRRDMMNPMTLMGQTWGMPPGPDGWPEADSAWITPQRMAARLQWGMTVPFRVMRQLPDPREFVEVALGPDAPEPVRFAAKAAETRAEGVGLVLASPAFQRM